MDTKREDIPMVRRRGIVGLFVAVTMLLLGLTTLPLFIGVVPFGLSAYAVLRDKRVKPEDRVFSRAFVSRAIVALAEKAGCGDEVERWLTKRPKSQVVPKDSVQFVKKEQFGKRFERWMPPWAFPSRAGICVYLDPGWPITKGRRSLSNPAYA